MNQPPNLTRMSIYRNLIILDIGKPISNKKICIWKYFSTFQKTPVNLVLIKMPIINLKNMISYKNYHYFIGIKKQCQYMNIYNNLGNK